jgi:hypothetical protein
MPLPAQNYLLGKVDVAGVEPGALKAVVHFEGLPGKETEVTFTEPFQGLTELCQHQGAMNADSQHGTMKSGARSVMMGDGAHHGMTSQGATREMDGRHASPDTVKGSGH